MNTFGEGAVGEGRLCFIGGRGPWPENIYLMAGKNIII